MEILNEPMEVIHEPIKIIPGDHTYWLPNNSTPCHERREGTSNVVFEVLIMNCKIDFINVFIFNYLASNINLLIFNCLALNINLFIFNCLTSNFCFPKNIYFTSRRE